MRLRRTNFAGFTLIELILVLLIMAVVAALAVPMLREFTKGQAVNESARQVVSLCRWAQTEASSRGISFRLNVDPVKRTYWLTEQSGPALTNALQFTDGTVAVNNYVQFDEDFGRTFEAPEGVTLDGSNLPQDPTNIAYIEFHPSGRCDPGVLLLRDGYGQEVVVGVLSATDRYHMLNPDEQNILKAMKVPPPLAPAR